MKVLLVDDESELVSAMSERLGFRGIDADWATSGEQALNMAAENEYDLAVLDMKMPKISGLELRRKLSAAYPAMKFIFLSGHGSERDFEKGSAESESYLIKPIQIEQLAATIMAAFK